MDIRGLFRKTNMREAGVGVSMSVRVGKYDSLL
jgi:hypothetical protein